MYQPTICIITPTRGRPTLERTINSITDDLVSTDDYWLVLPDGELAWSKVIGILPYSKEILLLEPQSHLPQGDYGNKLRDLAMSSSRSDCDYFVFIDDDDVFTPGAIDIIKREIAQHHPRPIMFRMINGNGEILWKTREVTPGNVGGSMFCVPNDPDKLGKWDNGQGHRSDFEFIRSTLEKYGPDWRQQLVWSGDMIIHCRPEGS